MKKPFPDQGAVWLKTAYLALRLDLFILAHLIEDFI